MTGITPTGRRDPAAAEVGRLRVDLLDAIAGWRRAKQTFAHRTAMYERRYPDTVTAEFKARADGARQQSVVDADWYQREVQTAALAILALDRRPT